jgi:N6-L-threonylcarbamoyladenine synthase
MPTILGIESTCDETAAAVVVGGRRVLSNIIASQADLHAKFRGVVPEIASRAHIENILPVLRESLESAKTSLEEIDAVAVAHRPGLIGSLLIGVTAAKTLAWAIGKPLIGVDHVQAHLYSVVLTPIHPEPQTPNPEPAFPAVGLVCSGGHTALYRIGSWTDIQLIGTTRDDAVGEAYDKVAAILNQGYPGGPILDRLAQRGDPAAVKFPRTLLGRDSLDFSFSGLKTALLYHVRGVPGKPNPPPPDRVIQGHELADLAASFQAACIDVLTAKLKRAVKQVDARSLLIGGGVSANRGLREALRKLSLPVHFPALDYCTDNAAMSAGLGHVLYEQRQFSPLSLDAVTHSRLVR